MTTETDNPPVTHIHLRDAADRMASAILALTCASRTTDNAPLRQLIIDLMPQAIAASDRAHLLAGMAESGAE